MKDKEATEKELYEASQGMERDYITLKRLGEMQASANPLVIIDLRDRPPRKPEHAVPGAVHISMENLVTENVEKAVPDKSTPVVLVCNQSFEMTRMVALTTYAYPTLKLMGYTCVKILRNWPIFTEAEELI